MDAIAKSARGALADGALFWSAYPKGTSKKYKGADINRDTGHARMIKDLGVKLIFEEPARAADNAAIQKQAMSIVLGKSS